MELNVHLCHKPLEQDHGNRGKTLGSCNMFKSGP